MRAYDVKVKTNVYLKDVVYMFVLPFTIHVVKVETYILFLINFAISCFTNYSMHSSFELSEILNRQDWFANDKWSWKMFRKILKNSEFHRGKIISCVICNFS